MNFLIKKSSPTIKYLGLTTLFSTLLCLSYFLLFGVSERIGWDISGYVDAIKTPLFSFNKWKTSFDIQTDSFLILEHFKANDIVLRSEYTLMYGITLLIGFSIYLSSISGLTRTLHAVAFGLFALLIGTLHLENLHFFSHIHDKAFTGLVLLMYLGISFYFHFNTRVSLFVRFITYLSVSIGLILMINSFTQNSYWYIESISYSFSSLTIITLLFVVFISLSIPFGILYITTFKNNGGENDSLKHFYVFYIIYLVNLVYSYLVVYYETDFGLYYIPPNLLFIISTLIGLWLIHQQEELFGSIIREDSILYWVYLGASIIATATYTYHEVQFDTSYIIALEQTITTCFIGFGFLMLFYISYNFYEIIKQSLPVHRIAFQPKNIDFLSSWGVGLLITIGLFYINNFTSYRHLWTSYYNNLGDVEYINGNKYLAEERYRMANMYSMWNFHSNYMLGNIAIENKRKDVAQVAYKNTSKDEAIEQSFVKTALIELENKNYLESIITLRRGLDKHPSSKEINNNLAIAFYQIGEIDSALHYLDQGITLSEGNVDILKSNYVAISALAKNPINDQSKYLTIDEDAKINQNVNQLAYLNANDITSSTPFNTSFIKDSTLNGDQVSYLYNFSINHRNKKDVYLNEELHNLISSDNNLEYREQLLFASYVNNTSNKRLLAGKHNLLELNGRYGNTNGYYLFLLGLDALKNNQFELAEEQLDQAFKLGQKIAVYPLAMASTQLNNRQHSIDLWNFVFKLNLLSEEDMTMIQHYLSNSELRSNNANEYYFQILFNHQKLNDTKIIAGLKKLDQTQQEDLINVILDESIRSHQIKRSKSLILELANSITLSDNIKAKFIQTDYLLELNLEDAKLWVDQLDINSLDGKLYSDIYKNTHFLETVDGEQLYANNAYIYYQTKNLIDSNKTEEGFQFISEQLQLNPYSEVATNSYLEACFSLGLKDYASSRKVEAEYLLSNDAVERVNKLYTSLLDDYNKKINQWDTLTE